MPGTADREHPDPSRPLACPSPQPTCCGVPGAVGSCNGSRCVREFVPPRAREITPSEPEVAGVCPALPPAFGFPLDSRLQSAGYSAPAQRAGEPSTPAASRPGGGRHHAAPQKSKFLPPTHRPAPVMASLYVLCLSFLVGSSIRDVSRHRSHFVLDRGRYLADNPMGDRAPAQPQTGWATPFSPRRRRARRFSGGWRTSWTPSSNSSGRWICGLGTTSATECSGQP